MSVKVFLLDGTHSLFDWQNTGVPNLGDTTTIVDLEALLNTEYCIVDYVDYPASLLPLVDSIDAGVTALTAAIEAWNNPFILAGYSQGAGIISLVLNQLLTGSLTAYASNCLAGVTFGNICRQEGSIAPVQTDPGGEGLWPANLLTDTPSWWWDFAAPYDFACTMNPSIPYDADLQLIAASLLGLYTEGLFVDFLVANVLNGNLVLDARGFGDLLFFGASLASAGGVNVPIPIPPGLPNLEPHGYYPLQNPPGTTPQYDASGNIVNTYVWYAANYINEIAAGVPFVYSETMSVAASVPTPTVMYVIPAPTMTAAATMPVPTV